MHMDDNELHPLKVLFSIRDTREPDSNVTVDRLLQLLKQPAPRFSTLDGMHMEGNELHPQKA
jgi:hypothetical protein